MGGTKSGNGKDNNKMRNTRFKAAYPKGRKEFSRAKRAIGLRRGQATNHIAIMKKLA